MSTLRLRRTSVRALLLAGVACWALTACEVDRPKGFSPTKRVATQGNSELFADGGSDGELSDGGRIAPPVIVDKDGGMPVAADSPLAKAQGYYWLRTDIEFTYSQSAGFQTVRVFNRASHMALTQLVAEGQTLKAIERTCHVFYQHKCQSACTSFSTTVAPNAAKLYRTQDLPRVYTLTNNNTMFVTNAASLTLGWTGPANAVPTSLSDPTVWNTNNDATSKGFYVNVKAGGLPQVVDCYYNTVERVTSTYSGELNKSGSLDGINVKMSTEGSSAKTLGSQGGGACVPGEDTPAPSRSTVRFAKVQGGASFWDCPAIADFKAKLSDPPGAP